MGDPEVVNLHGLSYEAYRAYTLNILYSALTHDHRSPSVGTVPRQSQPPYRVVSSALRERVEAGEWLPGEQLPTVREIAGQYGVSIATARKALGVLVEAGLIVVTPGWGS